LVTAEPAATYAPSPIWAGATITELLPTNEWSPTSLWLFVTPS
jgi:hypothetical protein